MSGSLTNWEYKPMIKIEEFLSMMDEDFQHPFAEMKSKQLFKGQPVVLGDLTKQDFQTYIRERIKFMRNYSQNWLTLLLQYATRGYQNPCLINMEEFDEFPSESYLAKMDELIDSLFPPADDSTEPMSRSRRKEMEMKTNSSLNLNTLLEEQDDSEQLWVGVTFARPGRHTYLVNYLSDIDASLNQLENAHSGA